MKTSAISTEASHQPIVKTNLKKAQRCHTRHAREQGIAAKFNHCGRKRLARRGQSQCGWHDEGSSPTVYRSMRCVGGMCDLGWRDVRVDAEGAATTKTSGEEMKKKRRRGRGGHDEGMREAGSARQAMRVVGVSIAICTTSTPLRRAVVSTWRSTGPDE